MTSIPSLRSSLTSYTSQNKLPETKEAQLKAAIFTGSIDSVQLLVALDPNIINLPFDGMLPLHAAVRLKQKPIVQYLISQGAKIDTKDFQGMSALDYAAAAHDGIMVRVLLPSADLKSLFAEASIRDPMRLQKIQILLGLLSVGAIGASSLGLDEPSAALISSAFTLLAIGTDLAVSYDAYLQLAPETVLGKAAYWATALGSIPFFTVVDKVPGAKIAWDIWRTTAVCRRAMEQMKVAYNNYSYDKLRSIGMVGTQLLAIGTTAYQVKDTFQALYNNLPYVGFEDPGKIAERLKEQERQQDAHHQERMRTLEQETSLAKNNLEQLQGNLHQREADLIHKEEAFNRKETAYTRKINEWSDAVKKEPICREVYQSQLDAYRERVDQITNHPILPFLLDPESVDPSSNIRSISLEDKYQSALCSLYGDKDSGRGIKLSDYSARDRKARYHELTRVFNKDKCPNNGCPDFAQAINEKAYRRLITAYEFLKDVENPDPQDPHRSGKMSLKNIKVKCPHKTVIIQSMPKECPAESKGAISNFFQGYGF